MNEKKPINIEDRCQECGHYLPFSLGDKKEYINFYGRICPNCQSLIDAKGDIELVRINKEKKEHLKKTILDYLRKKHNGN